MRLVQAAVNRLDDMFDLGEDNEAIGVIDPTAFREGHDIFPCVFEADIRCVECNRVTVGF
jgi:hypothetical protein